MLTALTGGVARLLRPLLVALVRQLVEEACGARYAQLARELEQLRARAAQLEEELTVHRRAAVERAARVAELELELHTVRGNGEELSAAALGVLLSLTYF